MKAIKEGFTFKDIKVIERLESTDGYGYKCKCMKCGEITIRRKSQLIQIMSTGGNGCLICYRKNRNLLPKETIEEINRLKRKLYTNMEIAKMLGISLNKVSKNIYDKNKFRSYKRSFKIGAIINNIKIIDIQKEDDSDKTYLCECTKCGDVRKRSSSYLSNHAVGKVSGCYNCYRLKTNALTKEQINDIITRRNNGEVYKTIAKDYGLSITAIFNYYKKYKDNI